MEIISLEQIKAALPSLDLMTEIEAGFVAYSKGDAVIPPVGEMIFDKPPGETHIKYGYLKNDQYYVLKVASGFYENPALGVPANNGLMLLFNKQTGAPEAILLDEGFLTDIRTAIAGSIAAKHLANEKIDRIGIAGTGVQALLQLTYLQQVTDCRDVLVWGRDANKRAAYSESASALGFNVMATSNAQDLLSDCRLIVTTTPAHEPILCGKALPGTHITAVGSDTAAKQELATSLLGYADLVVADSLSQCLLRGEIHHALNDNAIEETNVVELGEIIAGSKIGRANQEQVTVADLTGVAVQDIAIATAIYKAVC